MHTSKYVRGINMGGEHHPYASIGEYILDASELTALIREHVEKLSGHHAGIVEIVTAVNFHFTMGNSVNKPDSYSPQVYASVQLFAKPDTQNNTDNKVGAKKELDRSNESCQCEVSDSNDIVTQSFHGINLQIASDISDVTEQEELMYRKEGEIHTNRDLGDEDTRFSNMRGMSATRDNY